MYIIVNKKDLLLTNNRKNDKKVAMKSFVER